MPIAYKNENADKATIAEDKLKKIRNTLIDIANTDNEKAVLLLERLDDAIFDGEKEGKEKTINLLSGVTNNYLEFIKNLSKDLKPDNSYSYLNDAYHEMYQFESKGQNSNPLSAVARDLGIAKNIKEQEQTFLDKVDKALNDGAIKNVVAWITMTNLLNEYLLEPAREMESLTSNDAKELVQDALNKLTNPAKQGSFEKPKLPIALWFYLSHRD